VLSSEYPNEIAQREDNFFKSLLLYQESDLYHLQGLEKMEILKEENKNWKELAEYFLLKLLEDELRAYVTLSKTGTSSSFENWLPKKFLLKSINVLRSAATEKNGQKRFNAVKDFDSTYQVIEKRLASAQGDVKNLYLTRFCSCILDHGNNHLQHTNAETIWRKNSVWIGRTRWKFQDTHESVVAYVFLFCSS
jgi:hypothetical protein